MLLLIALVLAAAWVADVRGQLDFKKLVEMRCDGTINGAVGIAGGPVHFKMNGFGEFMDAAFAALKEHVACTSCQATDDKEIEQRYFAFSPLFFLQFFEGQRLQLDNSTGCELVHDPAESSFEFTFPTTCSYQAMFDSDAPCRLGATLPGTDMTLAVQIKRCSGTKSPSVAIYCKGSGCNYVGQPCEDNNGCPGGLGFECLPLFELTKSNQDYFLDLQDAEVFTLDDADSGLASSCLSFGTLIRKVMAFVRAEQQRASGLTPDNLAFTTDKFGVCAPTTLAKYRSADLSADGPLLIPAEKTFEDILDEVLGFHITVTEEERASGNYTIIGTSPADALELTEDSGFDTGAGTPASARTVEQFYGIGADGKELLAQNDDIVPLLFAKCDMTGLFLPLSDWLGFELGAYPILKIGQYFLRTHFDITECRANGRGVGFDQDKYDAYFLSILNVLRALTKPVFAGVPQPFPEGFSTLAIEAAEQRLEFPIGSCSYEIYITEKQCTFEYDGFSDLPFAGEKMLLQGYVSLCAGSVFPEAMLQCMDEAGTQPTANSKNNACRIFDHPKICDPANDQCDLANGIRCLSRDELGSLFNDTDDSSQSMGVEEMGPEVASDDAFNPFALIFAGYTEQLCGSNEEDSNVENLFRFLHRIDGNKPYDANNGICFFDLESEDTSGTPLIDTWADDHAPVEDAVNERITIPGLSKWETGLNSGVVIQPADDRSSLDQRSDFAAVATVGGSLGASDSGGAGLERSLVGLVLMVVMALLF